MTCSLDKFPKSIFFIVGFTLNPPFATIEYAVAKCNGVAEIPCPNDIVIVADAHQYLLDHYKEFDFIWSSPPCPTHSRLVQSNKNKIKMKYLPIRGGSTP